MVPEVQNYREALKLMLRSMDGSPCNSRNGRLPGLGGGQGSMNAIHICSDTKDHSESIGKKDRYKQFKKQT